MYVFAKSCISVLRRGMNDHVRSEQMHQTWRNSKKEKNKGGTVQGCSEPMHQTLWLLSTIKIEKIQGWTFQDVPNKLRSHLQRKKGKHPEINHSGTFRNKRARHFSYSATVKWKTPGMNCSGTYRKNAPVIVVRAQQKKRTRPGMNVQGRSIQMRQLFVVTAQQQKENTPRMNRWGTSRTNAQVIVVAAQQQKRNNGHVISIAPLQHDRFTPVSNCHWNHPPPPHGGQHQPFKAVRQQLQNHDNNITKMG